MGKFYLNPPTSRTMIVSVVFSFLILGIVQGSNVYRTTEPGTLAHGYYPGRYYGYASHGYYPGYTGYDSGYDGYRTGYSGTAGYAPSVIYPGQHSVSYPYDLHYPSYPRIGYSDSGYGTLAPSYPGQVSHGYYPSYATHGHYYPRTSYSDGGYGTLAPSYLKENEVQYPSLYYPGYVSHGYYPSYVSHGYYPRTGYFFFPT